MTSEECDLQTLRGSDFGIDPIFAIGAVLVGYRACQTHCWLAPQWQEGENPSKRLMMLLRTVIALLGHYPRISLPIMTIY